MLIQSIENRLLSAFANPLLRKAISRFDFDCDKDGSLMVNSLRQFLGEEIQLCEKCSDLSIKVAKPFYEVGSRLMGANKSFIKDRFLDQEHGDAWLKGFVLMMKGIRKFGIQTPFTPGGPFLVVWNLTYACNERCKHCYEDAGQHRPELTTEEAFLAIDKLSETASVGLPALSFSGGEPLMRSDFFEIASYADKKIPYLSIATNGTLLTEDNVKRLKDVGIDYAEVSLDGATREVHEEFRRVPGCFRKTLRGIENCISEDLPVCIATTVQKENFGELAKIMELAEEMGARFMHFNYIPTGRAKAYVDLDLTPNERFSVLEVMGRKIVGLSIQANEEIERTGNSSIMVDRLFSTCPQYASVVKKIARESKHDFAVSAHYAAIEGVENLANFLGGCGAGRLYMCLEPTGDIKPCVFFPTNKTTVQGNILRDDFEEIWDKSEMFANLRTRENLKSYQIGNNPVGCGTCEDKYICGGCRARSYSYFEGNLHEPDIGCIRNYDLWKKVVGEL
jgi:radical SAM protein with 4Fe4S-binding SPASM domain